jgi:hypothetical protein
MTHSTPLGAIIVLLILAAVIYSAYAWYRTKLMSPPKQTWPFKISSGNRY